MQWLHSLANVKIYKDSLFLTCLIHECCSPPSLAVRLKRCSTLDRQNAEVRSHHRVSLRRGTLATSPVEACQQDMPSRLQVVAWNCPIVPRRAMHTSGGRPCSEPLRSASNRDLMYPRTTLYATVSAVWALSVKELATSFCRTLQTRRWALLTFVEDLNLRYLTERIMRHNAHSWRTWRIRVGVISAQTYLLTYLLSACSYRLIDISILSFYLQK